MENLNDEDIARIPIDGSTLEVKSWSGTGTPILLLHEALGSVSMWRDFPTRLAERTGRRVVAWSRAGHGWSEKPSEPRGFGYLDEEAVSTLKLMDALDIERAVLHGHSDGTSIALIAAAVAPERVDRLILEAPHIDAEPQTLDAIREAAERYRFGELRTRLGRHHRDPDHVFRSWHDIWLDPGFRDWSIEALLPSVMAPTLMIYGLEDRYFSSRQLTLIERGLSAPVGRSELTDCGHSPYREQPEIVLDLVAQFLRAAAPISGVTCR